MTTNDQPPCRSARPFGRKRALRLALLMIIGGGCAAVAQSAQVLADQRAQYDAERPKSIIELQPFRQETSARLASGEPIRLISLGPGSNAWFLLVVGKDGDPTQQTFHIENPAPQQQTLTLATDMPPTLVMTIGGEETRCEPWRGTPSALAEARATGAAYAPLCGGHLLLRNHVSGGTPTLAWTADLLRSGLWGGDVIVGAVRDALVSAAGMATGSADGPDPAASSHQTVQTGIGLALTGTPPGRMALGQWYPVTGVGGVYASAIQPAALDAAILQGPGTTNPLDSAEARAMDYFVAFDLAQFDLGYTVGTNNPGLGWSPRPPLSVRNAALPGPDGVASPAPLVPLGMVSPALAGRLVATFAAGFKRRQGAFRGGPLSLVNHGSHYGFVEQGVILSKLQPGLATLFVLDDGSIHMKTWAAEDDARLPQVRFARQNGVALLEPDPAGGAGIPGPSVTSWLGGNWSGTADLKLRTLRAGACLKETGSRRFLIYGYFSTATPSAMARTFEGYGCAYAMLLDMNTPDLTYFALYQHQPGALAVEHLVPGMGAADKRAADGSPLPRFVSFPDNRDLFSLTRRIPAP